MTVTTFLLILFGLIIGNVIGIALYQWYIERVLKKSVESLIAECEHNLDFHQIDLQDGKKLTVSKSLVYDDKYVVVFENSNNPFGRCGVAYFDKDTLEVTTHGTVDC